MIDIKLWGARKDAYLHAALQSIRSGEDENGHSLADIGPILQGYYVKVTCICRSSQETVFAAQ